MFAARAVWQYIQPKRNTPFAKSRYKISALGQKKSSPWRYGYDWDCLPYPFQILVARSITRVWKILIESSQSL
jgi:hypothetical protein